MREPFISLFLAAFPVLVIALCNIVTKKYGAISSKSLNYFLLITTSFIMIYCIIAFVSSLVKDTIIKTILPNNTIFTAAIVISALGIYTVIRKKRHSIRLDFVIYFGIAYTSIIIIWRIVGFVLF